MWYGGVLAAVLAGFGVTTFLVMRHQLLERTDAGLGEELSDVLSEVERASDREGMLGWLDRRFAHHEGFDFQVTTTAGERVFTNLRMADRRLPVPELAQPAEIPIYETVSLPDAGRYRIVTRRTSGPDGPLVVQVARSLAELDHELAELLAALLIAGPAALVLTVGGGYFLARRALSPVDRMTVAASQIDARAFNQRLEVANPEDELGHFARTLNQMLDRLERSFNEMQRFTADASHELRTPITVIRTEAEVALGRSVSEPEKQELLGNILEECQRLTWITDQLLTLCREDAGVSALALQPVDVSQLAARVAETMRPLADAKSQRLAAVTNGCILVQGDPVRLRQVIYNLVDNAIKYTPAQGSVNVAVAKQDHSVRLIVEDSGIGIPPEHLPHVFERFYRVDKARTRSEGGAGLGLSIVQSIVHAHHGTVALESRPGRGTTCTVALPLPPGGAS
jgi:heavy metal sensor kinase